MVTNTDTESAQYRIWNDRFLCQMKYIDTLSVDYIKIFGTLTTFDSDLDRRSHNEIVDRYLTVIQMVEYYNDGVPLYIKKPEDSKDIYILIQTHLQNWKHELQVSLRPDSAPVEELEIMDKFADQVYEHAKFYLDGALVDSPFARTLKKDTKSVLNILKPPSEFKNDDESLILDAPKRDSMSDIFSIGAAQLERRF